MLNFIVWLFAGGIIGWLASRILRTEHQKGWLTNITVGIAGAFLGGLLLGEIFGGSTTPRGNFSPWGLVISMFSAIILLGLVNLLRRQPV